MSGTVHSIKNTLRVAKAAVFARKAAKPSAICAFKAAAF
jgi:hypothetical protein